MERLTFNGNFCSRCRELPCQHGGNCSQKQAWERLNAYEDTAMAIENTKRYHGAVYTKDVFSEIPQEIPYLQAAKVLREVSDAPAADVAPVVHARWIPSESYFDDDDTLFDGEECCDWQCSACREDICYEDPMPMKLLPNCCPNCGAIMDGGASE